MNLFALPALSGGLSPQAYYIPNAQSLLFLHLMAPQWVSGGQVKNMAQNGVAATITGSPSFPAAGGMVVNTATVDGLISGYIDPLTDLTLCVVAVVQDTMANATTTPYFISSLKGDNVTPPTGQKGVSLRMASTGATRVGLDDSLNVSGALVSPTSYLAEATPLVPHFYAGTIQASTGIRTIYDMTAGTSASVTTTGTRITAGTTPAFNIGLSVFGGNYAGKCTIWWAELHAAFLTQAQIQANYVQAKAWAQTLGTPIMF